MIGIAAIFSYTCKYVESSNIVNLLELGLGIKYKTQYLHKLWFGTRVLTPLVIVVDKRLLALEAPIATKVVCFLVCLNV